jgi:GAF domain-containing protein
MEHAPTTDDTANDSLWNYMLAVQHLTHAITQASDSTALLGQIMQEAVTHIDAAGAGDIFLWDEAQRCLIPRVWHNLGDWLRNVRLQLGEGVAGTAAQQRKSIKVNDYEHSPYASRHFTRRLTHSAVMASPMLYHDTLLGAITVGNEGTGRLFSDEHLHRLQLFASLASLTLVLCGKTPEPHIPSDKGDENA